MKKTKRSPKKNAALDRRDFIKTGAAAAALGSLSIERGAFAQADVSHAIPHGFEYVSTCERVQVHMGACLRLSP